MGLYPLLCRQWNGLSVPHASDVADEATFLVGDLNFYGGNLSMIGDEYGLSPKFVAQLGTGDKHDAVVDAEGQLPLTVHEGRDGQVCQGEECPTLADVPTVKVIV